METMEIKEKNGVRLFLNKTRKIDIEFEDITYEVKQKGVKKQLIKGVSGKFLSGELTAIMGPSGAGKTTLLNILTGMQVEYTSGSIKCNSFRENGALQYKKDSCYILQEDNLPSLFTVVEIMNIAADLKLKNISEKAKSFLIEDVLDNLGLTVCKKTKCQHLSGGQRKRLSVALELINNPPIMFLDEPTTGLDSSASSQCIQMLKNLAIGGRTIICTIHQPNAIIYEMFDHIYVLAQGHCVYQGSSTNSLPYLSSLGFNCPQYHNPADYLLEVINGDYGNHINLLKDAAEDQKWRKAVPKIAFVKEEITPVHQNSIYNIEQRDKLYEPPSEMTRFWILLYRYRIQLVRDWTISQLKLLLHILVGIFLGFTFEYCGKDASKVHANLGFLLACIVYLSYTSTMPAVLKFPSELAMLKKERFNNWYKLKTYFAAFLVSDIPIQASFTVVYTVTSYFISSQPAEWRRFIMVLVILTLVGLASSSLGLVVGTLVNPINGTFFGAITIAVMISGSGFLILFPHMPKLLYPITYMSFMSFALEGLMQAVYGYNRGPLECPEESDYCHYRYPEMLLRDVGMERRNYWIDVGYIFTFFVVFRILAFFTLRRKLSKA